MQTLNIILCDDDDAFRALMEDSLRRAFRAQDINITLTAGRSPAELWGIPALLGADLLFLDIDMPDTDGIAFGEQLRAHGCEADIIYVSNMEDKVYEIFRVHPWSFIRKSRFAEELDDVLRQYIAALRERSSVLLLQSTDGVMRSFGVADILYVESAGKNQRLLLQSGEIFSVRMSLYELEEKLLPMGFIRIHKGFLVNFRCIRKISSRAVTLDTGAELPIGRDRLASAKERYLTLMKWKGLSHT